MEDYRLTQSGQEVQEILNGAAMQSDLTAETERATEAEQTLQGNIDAEATRATEAEGTLQDNIDAEETRAKAAEKQNADDIDAIEEKIPSGASSSNKLATEEYVNDSVAIATATFRGTYNVVTDLGLAISATHAQIATALAGSILTADNNDYAFVLIPTSAETPSEIASIERYKFNGAAWGFEYVLNNSGFTAAQWAAINSGITSGDVAKLAALPTNAQLTTLLAGLQSDIDGEATRAQGAEGTLQDNIDAEETRAKAAEKQNADDIDAIEAVLPSTASSENKVATESEINSLSAAIEAILLLIPSAATSLNKLADKAFVNSSIATATATFRGTYNLVNDLGLTTSATHAQIATALAGAILTADNNDYAFVQIPTSDAMPTEIAKTERYKFNGTAWEYEYDLNNSGFTADQWAAINSGITQALVTKLAALPTNAELTTELGTLTSGITAINQKIPAAASQANKLVDNAAMESYIVQVLDVLTISYNVTSTDGHVTLSIEQEDGKITSVALTTSDIASAAALNLKASQADLTALASRVTTAEGNITSLGGRMTTAEGNITSLGGRMTTAEGNITSLGGRVSTNETDIANLQQLYNNLQQSKPVPVDALPETGQQQGVIYRLAGTTSYSDYMWNGSTWVLMATYNNAIDPRPKKASQNLVTSGGVFDNMGALDVSELNATENPHTLAQYVDLSAALAAIPTDYQKGGMIIKYVRTSDNKYVQYRNMNQNWSTTVSDWQGVDDEPNPTSNNLTKSKGVYDAIHSLSLNNFNVGANNNAVSQYIYGLISNQKYLLTFVDNNWDITGVTNHSKFKLCLFGVKNGQRVETITQVPVDDTVNKYYVFTYGDWDSLEVFIRATQDVKVYYTISSEEIPNLMSFDKKVQLYNNNNGYPIIKKVRTSLYFKSSNGMWAARCALDLNYNTNAELATALGVELVDISETDTGYIELQSTYSFVLSSSDNRLHIKSRDAVTLNDIVLLANVGGIIRTLNTDIFGFPYIDNRFNGIESNIEYLKNACNSYIGSIQRFVIPYSATAGQWRIFNFGLPQGWKVVLEVSSSTPEWINYIRLLNSPDGVSYGSSLGNLYIRNNKIEYIAQADIPFLGLQLALDGLKKDGSDNVIGGTVDFLLKVEKDYVSPYVTENTDVLIPQIRSHRTSKSATICFFTDLHNIAYTSTYNSENSVIKVIRHIVQGINIIKNSINIWTTIAGGDYLVNNDSTLKSVAIDSLYDLSDTLNKVEDMPKLIVKGNHDDNSMGARANMIEPDTYYKMLPLMFESNEVVIDASNPSGNYGYFDIKPQKIRIIYLNSVDIPWIEEGGSVRYKGQWTCGVQQAQLDFVVDALRFEEDGWSVMFVSHHCITPIADFADGASEYIPAANGGSQLLGIIEAFKNKTSFNGTIAGDFASVVNVDYTNNASNGIICLLNGHTHADRNTVKDDILFLATTTATQSNTYQNTDGSTYAPTPNSKNEGAADFITIDKLNGIIYLDRYGFGVSRKFYYTGDDIGEIPT